MSRILLLSAYDAPSHRRWRVSLVNQFPEHDWTVLTLPPRHFAWRQRGNALSWAFGSRQTLERPYDRVVATSITNLAALRGMTPNLATTPTVVYFHENQFAYPTRSGSFDVHMGVHDLYTALAADAVYFNSEFNRRSFIEGAGEMLARMPDEVPDGVVKRIERASEVLPVPLEEACFSSQPAERSGALTILWNHRWEYDKAPERFFDALIQLSEEGREFELVVAGQRFRTVPDVFATARESLSDHIIHWGWIESADDYRETVRQCDVVVSTALHEFQGLAVLEAVAAGCRPVVPDRLAYPEWFDSAYRYPSHDDQALDARSLADHLRRFVSDPESVRADEAPDVSRWRWDGMRGEYEEMLTRRFE